MRKRISIVSGCALALALTFTGAAQATTLGTTTQPALSVSEPCVPTRVIAQATSDSSVPYSVPATGTITQWQKNTVSDTPGAPVTLVVLRPAGAGFTVVGVDARTVPNPLPAGGVATYVLATPIAVQAGDTFGLYAGTPVRCYWHGGSTPLAATVAVLNAPSAPAPNQTLSRAMGGDSPAGYTMRLAATFQPQAPPPTTPTTPGTPTTPTTPGKKKCKKHKKHKRSASSAKKKCKKKKKR
jgi:hypothetical protein